MRRHTTLEAVSFGVAAAAGWDDDRVAGWLDGVNEHLIYTCSVLRSESTAAHLPFSGLRQE